MATLVDLANYTGECEVVGEGSVLVPEGQYELALLGWKTARMFNADKLVLEFRIVSLGNAFEKILSRYYNVEVVGKRTRYGRFRARRSSAFVREYAALFGFPRRLDRISMRKFASVVILGRVKTVTEARRRKIPKDAQYSVVAELLKVEAGGSEPRSGA